jgi:hypothetical protein
VAVKKYITDTGEAKYLNENGDEMLHCDACGWIEHDDSRFIKMTKDDTGGVRFQSICEDCHVLLRDVYYTAAEVAQWAQWVVN